MRKNSTVRPIVLIAAVALLAALTLVGRGGDTGPVPTPLSQALDAVESGDAVTARMNDGTRSLVVELADGTTLEAHYPFTAAEEVVTRILDAGVTLDVSAPTTPSLWRDLLVSLAPILLIIGLVIWWMKSRAGSPARWNNGRGEAAAIPDTRLGDVAGCEEVVGELREVVDLLDNPDRYALTGARLPKGILLEGPPGTGKTLLARAVAGEADAAFFAISGSDFVETYVGVGASRVRSIFKKAKAAKRAVIFIDEIDAAGRARSSGPSNGAETEREATLNALLVEMDGFDTTSNVVVIAATNRADLLDAALLRPGRFDRRIAVPVPDRRGREAILALHARSKSIAADVDLASLARRTPGMAGADLANVLNQAALIAGRAGEVTITAGHLDEALATVIMGRERRSASVTDRDRRVTAWHEAGHAVAALTQPAATDPVQVTIVPRGGAGGVTWTEGSDDQLFTRAEAHARLAVLMAGRAAEERLLDGECTQGAQSDFAHATRLARAMVAAYGMSSLGVAVRDLDQTGADAEAVAAEVDHILSEALDKARSIVANHGAYLDRVAQTLLDEETLTLAQLRALDGAPTL
jgi:cell division protease FtsH